MQNHGEKNQIGVRVMLRGLLRVPIMTHGHLLLHNGVKDTRKAIHGKLKAEILGVRDMKSGAKDTKIKEKVSFPLKILLHVNPLYPCLKKVRAKEKTGAEAKEKTLGKVAKIDEKVKVRAMARMAKTAVKVEEVIRSA